MRSQSIHPLWASGLYLVAHVMLDWLSFIHPYGAFGITPWNPSTGLGFVFVLRYGPRALPVVFAALMAANWLVRCMPVPLWIAIAEALVRTAVYGAAAAVLLGRRARFDVSLGSIRDLFLLLTTASVSSALIGGAYVGLLDLDRLDTTLGIRFSLLALLGR